MQQLSKKKKQRERDEKVQEHKLKRKEQYSEMTEKVKIKKKV